MIPVSCEDCTRLWVQPPLQRMMSGSLRFAVRLLCIDLLEADATRCSQKADKAPDVLQGNSDAHGQQCVSDVGLLGRATAGVVWSVEATRADLWLPRLCAPPRLGVLGVLAQHWRLCRNCWRCTAA